MKKRTRKFWSTVLTVVLVAVGCLGGYMIGSKISDAYFVVDKYAGLSGDDFKDDITLLGWEKKTPDQLTPAEVFQVCEHVLEETRRYKITGYTDLKTSIGVSQGMSTLDQRIEDDFRFSFVTYSKFVKVARVCDYQLYGDLIIYEGEPHSDALDDVTWSDKHEDYTWESYNETFGKYANTNCSYYVGNATTISSEFLGKENGQYTFKLVLDPIKSTICYAKQIGTNMGINPSSVNFGLISVTFTIDSDWHFIKQVKREEYSLPYMGVTVSCTGDIETNFNYNV